MIRRNIFILTVIVVICCANPAIAVREWRAIHGVQVSAWTVAMSTLWLLPLGIIVSQPRFLLEQYCANATDSFCCNPPPNPINWTITDCVAQNASFGNCPNPKFLYCPGSNQIAPFRATSSATSMLIASGIFFGFGLFSTAAGWMWKASFR
jgi:hypothetical protein